MKGFFITARTLLFGACLITLSACEGGDRAGDTDLGLDTTGRQQGEADTSAMAFADLQPTEGNDVHGTVSFTEVEGGVRIVASVMGLQEGQHGFHVHEFGDCSAPDATSAGGHFNPDGAPHGAPTDPGGQRHVGDLGNVEADASGNASYERVDGVLALSGPNSIVGKAVVVHSDADDLESQPTGNAGDRLACGVIHSGSSQNGGMMDGMSEQAPGSNEDREGLADDDLVADEEIDADL